MKKLIAIALIGTIFVSSGAWAVGERSKGDGSVGAIVIDAVLVRPLGLATTVVGTAAFIVSLPFAALGGNVRETAENLVLKPAAYTFERPLGHLRR